MPAAESKADKLRTCFSVLGYEARASAQDGSVWQVVPRHVPDMEPVTVQLVDHEGRPTTPTEASLQARYGLMHLFGLRDDAGPRRLAVPFATAVSAAVAAQAVLAAQVARTRGGRSEGKVAVQPGGSGAPQPGTPPRLGRGGPGHRRIRGRGASPVRDG